MWPKTTRRRLSAPLPPVDRPEESAQTQREGCCTPATPLHPRRRRWWAALRDGRESVPEGGSAVNLASIVVRSAPTYADRAALRMGDDTLSYRELDQASARVAGLL